MGAVVDLGILKADAQAKLASLRGRRAAISLDVLAGDDAAAAELAELDIRITAAETAVRLAEDAAEERERRAQMEAAKAAEAVAARLRAEMERLEGELGDLVD